MFVRVCVTNSTTLILLMPPRIWLKVTQGRGINTIQTDVIYRLYIPSSKCWATAQKRRAEYPEYAGRVVGGAGMSFWSGWINQWQFYRAHLDVYIAYEILYRALPGILSILYQHRYNPAWYTAIKTRPKELEDFDELNQKILSQPERKN
jgi:hypothetical protein